jgi:hypothetical protein
MKLIRKKRLDIAGGEARDAEPDWAEAILFTPAAQISHDRFFFFSAFKIHRSPAICDPFYPHRGCRR